VILFRLRHKKINARPKAISALVIALTSGLLVSIPVPANAAACNPTSTTVGIDTVLTFATVGSCDWTPPTGISTFELLVVGAGGGAGSSLGGGGGGGRVISQSNVTISQTATITVGAGGAGGTGSYSVNTNHGKTGGKSSIVAGSVDVVSLGGSGGKGRLTATNLNSDGTATNTGWTGGGGAYPDNANQAVAVAGVGGSSVIGGNGSANGGGGGGGAGGPGVARGNGTTPASAASSGGIGISNSITGTATYYGGGGGASWFGGPGGWTGAGGLGGGGQGANGNSGSISGSSGAANTGGGGGGGYDGGTGGSGGSGIVIIKYGIPDGSSLLSFNANGGTGSDASSLLTTGTAGVVPSSTNIRRAGFEFNGWNTVANGSGGPYALGAAITISANTILYAQWIRIPGPSCAAGVGKGGVQAATLELARGGHGCVGVTYKLSNGTYTTVTFNYTGADQSWTSPTGATSLTFFLIGAGGGSSIYSGNGSGGSAGFSIGTYAVSAQTTFKIIVGQGGYSLGNISTYGGGGAGGGS
jgi:hypothetical protein